MTAPIGEMEKRQDRTRNRDVISPRKAFRLSCPFSSPAVWSVIFQSFIFRRPYGIFAIASRESVTKDRAFHYYS